MDRTGNDWQQDSDTLIVIRELFGRATSSVLVAGFAVHRGRSVLRRLAERMETMPELQVRLFLNIARRQGTASPQMRSFAPSPVRSSRAIGQPVGYLMCSSILGRWISTLAAVRPFTQSAWSSMNDFRS